ncbi:hypothetical protein BH10BAC2_BH10BAC2_34250 [soil metagenome]
MHFLKTLLLYTLFFLISDNSIAQQKDTVAKKENTGLFKHMKVPGYVLADADKDGITDQLDKELNTAKGCPVDSHGVSLDTDKDGVIDCKDKEPLTQRDCFPVDVDGIGFCPEPDCCRGGHLIVDRFDYMINNLPSVTFSNASITFNDSISNTLDSIVYKLNMHPYCRVAIYGYYQGNNKTSQKLSEQRVDAIVKYLIEKGLIDSGRILFDTYPGIKVNTIDFFPINRE